MIRIGRRPLSPTVWIFMSKPAISHGLKTASWIIVCLTFVAALVAAPIVLGGRDSSDHDPKPPRVASYSAPYTPSPVLQPSRTALPSLRPETPVRPTVKPPAPKPVVKPPVRRATTMLTTTRRIPSYTARSHYRPPLHPKPPTSPRAYARSVLSAGQFSCFSSIISRESGWNVRARNPYSGAYGLPQALPGSKMARYGSDWRTNGVTQVKWAIHYVDSRYGSPCGAWSFWRAHLWY